MQFLQPLRMIKSEEANRSIMERLNYINHGESMIVDNVHPINKWLNNPHLKMMDRDTDYVPNCN